MCVWEILGLPHVLGSFQEKAGGEPSGHAPKGEGRVTHSSRPLLPSRVVSKKRVEGDQMWGWGEGDQVEETDFFFLCHSMVIAALRTSRLSAAWGPSCTEQNGVWEEGRHRNGGQK